MLLNHVIDNGSAIDVDLRINNDSGANYAYRESDDGAADVEHDGTGSGENEITLDDTPVATERFSVSYITNFSTKEKLLLSHLVDANTAGEGTAPSRVETAGKWANTSVSLNRFDILETQAGAFTTDSELVVLGWDPDDIHADNFWEELASVPLGAPGDNLSSGTFTAKKYLWVQVYCKATGGAITGDMSYNNDTATNYARRFSNNGGADTPQTTISHLLGFGGSAAATPFYASHFIINRSANEKLNIGHEVGQSTAGAGTVPNRVEHAGKWDNLASQITEIDIDNFGAGSYDVGSILKVWGAD